MTTRAFDLSHIGAGLAVAATAERLPQTFAQPDTRSAVIQAPPGTGKTTLVPPALSNILTGNESGPSKVIVTAPRRVAVRSAARRLAQLDGSKIGERVGYTIRGDNHPGSLIDFVTPGVLLRRLLSTPELPEIGAVIIDEVHERHADSDLALALCVELMQLREDFRVIAMSATVDSAAFAQLMDATVLETPAVTYPLEISYAPHDGRIHGNREFYRHLARLALDAVGKHNVAGGSSTEPVSALVFVPGLREVTTTVDALTQLQSHSDAPDVAVLPLHGQLNNREQDLALEPSTRPRIVVTTSIAESSLTVPGVRIVVDSVLSRTPRRDAARNTSGLVTLTSAQSTADQRAGRAGRQGPGIVIRACAPADYQRAPAHITPEIASSDLTAVALTLASWGTPRGEGLALPTAPPQAAITAAEHTLRSLGAVNDTGAITNFGRQLSAIPVDPRLGRALLTVGPSAAHTIAALSVPSTQPQLIERETQRLSRLAARYRDKDTSTADSWTNSTDAGTIIGLAYPERIARKVTDSHARESQTTYLLASGTRAVLRENTQTFGSCTDAEWIAVADLHLATTGRQESHVVIRAAAPLSEETARDIAGVEEELLADFTDSRLRGRKIKRLGAIELASTPVTVPAEKARHAVTSTLRSQGLSLFRFSAQAHELYHRLKFVHQQCGHPWPEPDSVDPEFFLGPEIDALCHGTPPSRIDLYPALMRLLPWPQANDFDTLAPPHLTVPSGSQPRIDYSQARPTVRVKLQECFGLQASPECAGVKIQFHLLSPAGRPLAITDDLRSFWSGPYHSVRAEMRGRYPKHPWPEDPWSAPATSRTTKRSNK